jgi:hypothetical protein
MSLADFFASAISRPLKSLAQRIADEKHVSFSFLLPVTAGIDQNMGTIWYE